MIDTSDRQALAWLDPNKINPQPAGFVFAPNFGYLPRSPEPSPHGVICQDHPTHFRPYLELHRNGCVDYGYDLAFAQAEGWPGFWYFGYVLFCLKLLHTLQFASMVHSRYNYFGDVRIVVSIRPSDKLVFPTQLHLDDEVCRSNSVTVERGFPSTMLESDYSYIASGMMHDIFNHFGFWRCELFDDKGNYIRNKFV